jgi:hypothetical protein
MRPQQLTLPSRQSLLHGTTENHKPEQVQIITIYNCSTSQAREQRIRSLKEIIDEYLVGYRLRYRAPRFANYALGHVSRLLGTRLAVDIDANSVLTYQEDRLREGAAAKSINEEVRFLLKMLWAIQLPRTIGRMETGGGATDAT